MDTCDWWVFLSLAAELNPNPYCDLTPTESPWQAVCRLSLNPLCCTLGPLFGLSSENVEIWKHTADLARFFIENLFAYIQEAISIFIFAFSFLPDVLTLSHLSLSPAPFSALLITARLIIIIIISTLYASIFYSRFWDNAFKLVTKKYKINSLATSVHITNRRTEKF